MRCIANYTGNNPIYKPNHECYPGIMLSSLPYICLLKVYMIPHAQYTVCPNKKETRLINEITSLPRKI